MIDEERIMDYTIGGFSAGAVSYALLEMTSAITGMSMYTLLGEAFFGALTVLGIVGGILKGRRNYPK